MTQSKRIHIACVVGTRPEVIKMAPIIFKLQQCSWATVSIINTAQHRHLLEEMFTLFELKPDFDLDSMKSNQSLGELTGTLCINLDFLVKQHHFDLLLAVGDTTTVFVSSLIAFYHQIPFGHIEAGLRTYNVREPFPEELNRVLAMPLSTWHFAPTSVEKKALLREHVAASQIMVSGNPVIDALYWVLEHKKSNDLLPELDNLIIVTAHRRENFGEGMQHICQAIIQLTQRFPYLNFIVPVHPNPKVQKDILSLLGATPGVHLLDPLRYDQFVHLMNRCLLIMTDSGGIQEEAPALRKPVVVLRNTTERPEVMRQHVGVLVGTQVESIVDQVTQLLLNAACYNSFARGISPYGDGHAAERIVDFLYHKLLPQEDGSIRTNRVLYDAV